MPHSEDLLKLSADAARTFTNTYYRSVESNIPSVEGYYLPTAGIVWNGNTLTGGKELVEFLMKSPKATYEVQCYDAQVTTPDGKGSCTFMLQVSGTVKYGDDKSASRGFSDTFLMKPDVADNKKFLIAHHGFRLVV